MWRLDWEELTGDWLSIATAREYAVSVTIESSIRRALGAFGRALTADDVKLPGQLLAETRIDRLFV